MATLHYYWFQGQWFQLPFGFGNPWTDTGPLERITDRERYIQDLARNSMRSGYDVVTGEYNPGLLHGEVQRRSVAFWMPDRRWVERNIIWAGPSSRYCEAGRPRPTKGDYVVRMWLAGVGATENNLERLPERLRQMITVSRTWVNSSPENTNPEYVPSASVDVTGERSYTIYGSSNDLWVHFRCGAYAGAQNQMLNPHCRGYAVSWPRGLAVELSFPADHGQSGTDELWREPVEAAFELIQSWEL
jgi:hypothetical protein